MKGTIFGLRSSGGASDALQSRPASSSNTRRSARSHRGDISFRSRASGAFGGAAASITAAKQDKLLKVARHYLATLSSEPACRFDAVLITGDPPQLEWLRNAFEA
jgi:hypothetical protein